MTETKNPSIHYLDRSDIKTIHDELADRAKKDGEPIPSFFLANQHEIEALVSIPQRLGFGMEHYPFLEAKAAIIFYTINKKHIFVNGNKRMSTACLLVFLKINNKILNITADELTQKALWLSESASKDFQEIKISLESWIKNNMIDDNISPNSL